MFAVQAVHLNVILYFTPDTVKYNSTYLLYVFDPSYNMSNICYISKNCYLYCCLSEEKRPYKFAFQIAPKNWVLRNLCIQDDSHRTNDWRIQMIKMVSDTTIILRKWRIKFKTFICIYRPLPPLQIKISVSVRFCSNNNFTR